MPVDIIADDDDLLRLVRYNLSAAVTCLGDEYVVAIVDPDTFVIRRILAVVSCDPECSAVTLLEAIKEDTLGNVPDYGWPLTYEPLWRSWVPAEGATFWD